jgi:hypothetical protein
MRAVNVLITGFSAEETQRLSDTLLGAGFRVLGAVGRQGARTFALAASPEAVLVPEGPDGDHAREWLADLDRGLRFVEAPPGADAATLARRLAELPPSEAGHTRPSPRPEPADFARPEREAAPAHWELQAAAPAPAPAPAPPLPGPATARARRPTSPDAEAAEGREPHPEMVSKLAQVRFGDYHSILEVEPGGSPYAVREAFERLARRFSARGWPHRLQPEEIDMLDEIGRGLSDAQVVLGEPELRARYERALAGAALSGTGRP